MATPQQVLPHALQQVLPPELQQVQQRTLLPVVEPLQPLFPYGGLVRGSVLTVDSVMVAFALMAAASKEGVWCGAAGVPSLGLAAAAEAGVDLSRLAVVPSLGEQWAVAVATLLDGLGVVLLAPPRHARSGDVRRLAARVRESRGVLIALGGWPPQVQTQVDLSVRLGASEWTGPAEGYGRLTRRRTCLVSSGRGAAARERRVTAWLPPGC